MKEAYAYEQITDNRVRCQLCPHRCVIGVEGVGSCKVRKNIEGKLMALNYGELSSLAFDPVEKKPLRHFHPGQHILSIGSFGCNFSCDFCQNWQIAQIRPKTQFVTTEQLIGLMQSRPDNIGIAYTYNEPTVFYEYVLDTAKAVRDAGYKNVMVTNGYINPEPLKTLLQYVDAFNVDLKAFDEGFYHHICSGTLSPVMETIKAISGAAHIEITVLLIDGYNTDERLLEEMFRWLGGLDQDMPLHLTRYFPANRMKTPATQVETLKKAKVIAERYLNRVYLGNV